MKNCVILSPKLIDEKTMLRSVRAFLLNRPRMIDSFLGLLVILHAVLSLADVIPNVWDLHKSTGASAGLVELYIGALGASAIVAGFAGVVVIFVLTAAGNRFRNLRIDGGKALISNLISTSASGFLASLMFLFAALISIQWRHQSAPFLFEFGVVIIVHGSLRLLWLLYEMAEIVRASEIDSGRQQPKSARDLF